MASVTSGTIGSSGAVGRSSDADSLADSDPGSVWSSPADVCSACAESPQHVRSATGSWVTADHRFELATLSATYPISVKPRPWLRPAARLGERCDEWLLERCLRIFVNDH